MTPRITKTPSWKTRFTIVFAVFLIGTFVPGRVLGSSYDPSTVLVLVNDAYPPENGTNGVGASVWVGQHYAEVRGIPAANVLHLNIPLSVMHSLSGAVPTYDFLYYADYYAYLQTPVLNYMAQQGITNKILYVVPTYGIPYLLFDGLPGDPAKNWRISLDSILAGMNSNYTNIYLVNPYRTTSNSDSPAHFDKFTNRNGWKMYLVTRLDGPSAVIAAGLVDKAMAAENDPLLKTSGTGYYDWAGDMSWPNSSFKNAYDLGVAAGVPSVLNNQLLTNSWFSPASTYRTRQQRIYVYPGYQHRYHSLHDSRGNSRQVRCHA